LSYFGMFWKYIDLCLIALGVTAGVMIFGSGVTPGELAQLMSQSQQGAGSYQNFYKPAIAIHKVNVIFAAVMFFAWFKVCRYYTTLSYTLLASCHSDHS